MAEKLTKVLDSADREALRATLEGRFVSNMERHRGLARGRVLARLEEWADALWSLNETERLLRPRSARDAEEARRLEGGRGNSLTAL